MTVGSEQTVVLLRGVPVFSDLPAEDLEQVAAAALRRSFAAGETVFREGDEGDTCFVVTAGRVRVVRQHTDGRTIALATFGPGEFFGELALFGSERRSATVEALAQTETTAIHGADMRRLLRADPELALRLLAALGRRLRETNERLARQSFQTVPSRVAAALARLVAEARARGAGDTEIVITITQVELAQLAGSSRESASRFLAILVRSGVISQGRGRLTVHDPTRLEGYVY
ncbi:MAG: Crp/Fnr family transcriptional regulator [Solirubrobacteraceae bacterium]